MYALHTVQNNQQLGKIAQLLGSYSMPKERLIRLKLGVVFGKACYYGERQCFHFAYLSAVQ